MKAIVVTDQAAGRAGMKLVERPEPQGSALAGLSGANLGDVIVQVHASGFTKDELSWPSRGNPKRRSIGPQSKALDHTESSILLSELECRRVLRIEGPPKQEGKSTLSWPS